MRSTEPPRPGTPTRAATGRFERAHRTEVALRLVDAGLTPRQAAEITDANKDGVRALLARDPERARRAERRQAERSLMQGTCRVCGRVYPIVTVRRHAPPHCSPECTAAGYPRLVRDPVRRVWHVYHAPGTPTTWARWVAEQMILGRELWPDEVASYADRRHWHLDPRNVRVITRSRSKMVPHPRRMVTREELLRRLRVAYERDGDLPTRKAVQRPDWPGPPIRPEVVFRIAGYRSWPKAMARLAKELGIRSKRYGRKRRRR